MLARLAKCWHSFATCDSIGSQSIRRTCFPGERPRQLFDTLTQRLLPVVVFDDAPQRFAPAVEIAWIDEMSAPADRFGNRSRGRGDNGPAAGHHLQRRQPETLIK